MKREPLPTPAQPGRRILVWDLPTRFFHWALAASFAGAWISSDGDAWLSVHVFLGYLMLALVAFRLVWGWLGTRHARFASFPFSPRNGLHYLRQLLAGHAERHLGHNPAGSLAIYGLLLLTLLVGATGWASLGGEEQQGLASAWLGIAQGRVVKKLHEAAATLMLMLVIGHLIGVLVESRLHRENLARAMLTGLKRAGPDEAAVAARRPVAVLMLAAAAAFGLWWFFYALHPALERQLGLPLSSADTPHVKFTGRQLADNALWREECGSCHLAFHPSLLPARAWQHLMATQDQHFGADLALDAATAAAIGQFLAGASADAHATEPALKISQSLAADAVPLRVTETPYWVKKHRELGPAEWQLPTVKSKSNCSACHLDAEAGTFEDAAMKVPRR